MADAPAPATPSNTSAQPGAAPPAAALSLGDDAAAKRLALRAQVMAGAVAQPPETPAAAPAAPAAPAAAPPIDGGAPDTGESPALVAARKAELQFKRQMAQARAELEADFETKLSGWRPRMDKAEQYEKQLALAQQDPIEFLKGVGYNDAQFGALSRLLYGASPEGQKDPRYKQAGEKQLAESKLQAELEQLKRQFSEREETEKQTAAQRETQARIDSYADSLTKDVGDSTPLLKLGLTANTKAVRGMMLQVADELYVASGSTPDMRELPSPQAVVAEYERRRTAQLEAMRPEFEALAARSAAAPAAVTPPATPPQTPSAPNGMPVRKTRAELLDGIAKIRQPGA